MKTLGKRINLGIIERMLVYALFSYLLASWGVNGVIHPMHYIRSMTQQVERLDLSVNHADIEIRFPVQKGQRKYLSFEVAKAEDYFFSLELTGTSLDLDESWTKWVKVNKGWNCVDLSDCSSEKIIIPHEIAAQEGMVLKNAVLSEYRTVDLKQTAYIFAVYLFLIFFWECVRWIKKHYAE